MMQHGGMMGGMMKMGGTGSGSGTTDHEGHGAHEGHAGMDMGGMMCGCGMNEHVEGRLAFLKAELKITDAQSAPWTQFADTLRSTGQKMAQACEAEKKQGGSMMSGKPAARLEHMERHMTAHLEAVRALKPAVDALYASLSDEQKKAADQLMFEQMAIGMSMGKGMMGM
jgi:hypothetical protein